MFFSSLVLSTEQNLTRTHSSFVKTNSNGLVGAIGSSLLFLLSFQKLLKTKQHPLRNVRRIGRHFTIHITHSVDSQSTRHRKSSATALMCFVRIFVVSIENKIYALSLLNQHCFCFIPFHSQHRLHTHTHKQLSLTDSLYRLCQMFALFSSLYFIRIRSCLRNTQKNTKHVQ